MLQRSWISPKLLRLLRQIGQTAVQQWVHSTRETLRLRSWVATRQVPAPTLPKRSSTTPSIGSIKTTLAVSIYRTWAVLSPTAWITAVISLMINRKQPKMRLQNAPFSSTVISWEIRRWGPRQIFKTLQSQRPTWSSSEARCKWPPLWAIDRITVLSGPKSQAIWA